MSVQYIHALSYGYIGAPEVTYQMQVGRILAG